MTAVVNPRGVAPTRYANEIDVCADRAPPQASLGSIVYAARTSVAGYGGVNVKAYTFSSGRPGKNILFMHGYAHSHLVWKNQLVDPQLLLAHNVYAYDYRGIGESDRPFPTGPGPADTIYAPGENHADDLNAVITTLGISPCVLVAHSLGNFIVQEYIRKYGQGAVSGIVWVGGMQGPVVPAGLTPGLLALAPLITSADLEKWAQGLASFIRISTEKDLDIDTHDTFMLTNAMPPAIAGSWLSVFAGPRLGPPPANNVALYASIIKPSLIIMGQLDAVVLPSNATAMKQAMTSIVATLKLYDGVGHVPQMEAITSFRSDLVTWLGTF